MEGSKGQVTVCRVQQDTLTHVGACLWLVICDLKFWLVAAVSAWADDVTRVQLLLGKGAAEQRLRH